MTEQNIEDALEFLAGYHKKNVGTPTPRLSSFDQPVVNNLASKSLCRKVFSEKQAKLAIVFVRKYRNQLRRGGLDIDDILRRKTFRMKPLIAIPFILCFEKEKDDDLKISLSFPYDNRIIKLLHERNSEMQSSHYSHRFEWDSNDKKWTSKLFIDNFEFAYKIAKENNFYIEPIVEQYMLKIKEHRRIIKKPSVQFEDGKLVFRNLFDEQRKYLEKKFDV